MRGIGLLLVTFELPVGFENPTPFEMITNFKAKLIKLSAGCKADIVIVTEIIK